MNLVLRESKVNLVLRETTRYGVAHEGGLFVPENVEGVDATGAADRQ